MERIDNDDEVHPVAEIAVDPRELDKQFASMARARRNGYGMDYSPGMVDYSPVSASVNPDDIPVDGESEEAFLERCYKTVARIRAEGTPKEISARYRKFLAEQQACDDTATTECEMPTHDCSSQDSPQETQAPFVSVFSARPGACELLFVSNQKSPQQLVAMVTGLPSSLSTEEVYPTQHIFDMELDERLKVFPGKIQIMPRSQHLVAEVHRRSVLLDVKGLRKAARRNELIEWLKANPIVDPIDTKFLVEEINKTYRGIRLEQEELLASQQASLANRNWAESNWLRLYCAAFDDNARPLMLTKDDCMTRLELDARNSSKRSPSYYQVVAENYNSDTVYVTKALPSLHDDFADQIVLRFQDLPGGSMTAEQVKNRLSDARAKLIPVVYRWEQSGNGFGQRDEDDEEFGHYVSGRGDSRASFLKASNGQRTHHLYLWNCSDEMGVLKNFLNVLSQEVAGDSDQCPTGLSSTQRKRRPEADDTLTVEDKRLKQVFRNNISATLHSIGKEVKLANTINAESVLSMNVHSLRGAISDQEDRIERYTAKRMATTNPELVRQFDAILHRQKERLQGYEEAMQENIANLNEMKGSQP
jgi:hypothetical protein